VLSTISTAASTSGFPLGSIVEYGLDAQGRPIFSLSSLSGHTRDIRANPRCSLTVTSPGFRVVKMSCLMGMQVLWQVVSTTNLLTDASV
jgi:putative heme iron utilization protein